MLRLWAQGAGLMASSVKSRVGGLRFVVEGLSLRAEEGGSDEKKYSTKHIGKVSLPCRSASSRSTLITMNPESLNAEGSTETPPLQTLQLTNESQS